jgi:hypothetical protein
MPVQLGTSVNAPLWLPALTVAIMPVSSLAIPSAGSTPSQRRNSIPELPDSSGWKRQDLRSSCRYRGDDDLDIVIPDNVSYYTQISSALPSPSNGLLYGWLEPLRKRLSPTPNEDPAVPQLVTELKGTIPIPSIPKPPSAST